VLSHQFAVKWKAVGIWGCKDWGKVKAGGGAHHEVCPLSEFFRLLKLQYIVVNILIISCVAALLVQSLSGAQSGA